VSWGEIGTTLLGGMVAGAVGLALWWFERNAERRRKQHLARVVFGDHLRYMLSVLRNARKQIALQKKEFRGVLGRIVPEDLLSEYRPALIDLLTSEEIIKIETAYRQCRRNDEIMHDALMYEDKESDLVQDALAVYHNWIMGNESEKWFVDLECIARKLTER